MRLVTLALVCLLLGASAGVSAHEDFRVIGTITKRAGTNLAVTNKQGKVASIRVDKQTVISRDKKKVDAAELKVGLSVVVDAYGDSEDDLLALEIRIVPPIGGNGSK